MQQQEPEMTAKNFYDFFVAVTSLLADQIPIPMNFIDQNCHIVVMNQAFLRYLNLKLEDVVGKHITEIEPTVRLPIVMKTGKAEIGHRQRFKDGRECIVHRIPIYYKEKVIGGLGIILIDDLNYFYLLQQDQTAPPKRKKTPGDEYVKAKYSFDDILTQSYVGKSIKKQAEIYAGTDFNVLITGESGVGKELFAHAIHRASSRKDRPFIRINCAAIPENLMEAELFGYERGAFSGARSEGYKGKFEQADGGTLFLDEIGELPFITQAKLLRVLQENEIERVGGQHPIRVDVRVIAATNSSLEEKLKAKEFRPDLYYRLNVLRLAVPPLRERREDIPLLIAHFVTMMYQKHDIYREFSPEVIEMLTGYDWQGNVRELCNVVESMAVNAGREQVTKADLPEYVKNRGDSFVNLRAVESPRFIGSLEGAVAAYEESLIRKALVETNGNKTKAAELLGLSRMALYRKLEKMNQYA